ncbi:MULTISPECIES: amidase [unclassified Pseudomonas]|uniref:amidase n=1 Tax=unclassified Pseudomonas TaxID=196821 RepID=UPI0025F69293|nr:MULTISPECIES: amidase [unclassified Pseudomonas]
MTDLHRLSIAEVAALYQVRDLSPVDYVGALAERVRTLDPLVNAFIEPMLEQAQEDARQAEAEIFAGYSRSPLHGIPIGIKDIIDVAGMATTCHSKLMLEHRATADARVVSQLRSAGAIIMGKLSTHEFALGGPSVDLPFPPALNPWNLAHNCGGSSSGSAAAVAAGFVPAAIGTDTGGSIRHPASHCGIVGMKPSFGLVSVDGVFPLAYSLDHVGPLTKTVADNALVLDAIASASARGASYGALLQQGVKGKRIGVIRHFYNHDTVADEEMLKAIEDALAILLAAGANVETVTLPPLADFENALRVIMCTEAAAIHEHNLLNHPGDFAEFTRLRLLPGLFTTGVDYVQAQRRRQQLTQAVEALFDDHDILITASIMDPACRMDDRAAIDYTYTRQSRMPFNLSGHPALSIMCGISKLDGVPLAVQIIGRRWAEAEVYAVAAEYERLTPWHQMFAPAPL